MENQTENQSQQIEYTKPNYPDSKSKVRDLMLGCFAGGALLIILGIMFVTVAPEATIIGAPIFVLIMAIVFIVIKRWYISFGLVMAGIALAIIIPLIILGACAGFLHN